MNDRMRIDTTKIENSSPPKKSPAIPQKRDLVSPDQSGISRRDYFAIEILSVLMTRGGYPSPETAANAVKMADSLLAELDKN